MLPFPNVMILDIYSFNYVHNIRNTKKKKNAFIKSVMF